MNRFNNFETDASKALYLSTYRCPENEGNGFKVLLLVDDIKSAKDEILARITGVEPKDLSKPEMADLVIKQWDAWDDKETLRNNLRIVRIPLEKRTNDYVKALITKMEKEGFNPDFVIGSNDEDLNEQLEEFIEPLKEAMTDFTTTDDLEEFALSEAANVAKNLFEDYKKNKK